MYIPTYLFTTYIYCHNLSLGLTTKAKACKGVGQMWRSGATFQAPNNVGECERMNIYTPKWTPTLGVGVSMDSQIFKKQLQGSKPIRLRIFLYHWKSFGTQMSKMGSHDPFGHSKDKLWPKKGLGVKCDSSPLKVDNSPNFLACRRNATYHWKALDEGYNFASYLISIGGLHTKLWAPKIAKVLIVGISRLGNLGTKWHLGVGHVARHRVYYKGEGGGFPQVQVVMSFMSSCLPMARQCTKMFQLRINQLVVWFT